MNDDEEILEAKLHTIEVKMYDIICSMAIALRGEGASTEHNVTQDVLSADFLSLGKSLTTERYRVYILMKDTVVAMNYLEEIYTALQSSQTV